MTLEEDRLRRLASRMKKHDQGPKDEDTLSDIRLFQEISDDSPPPSALAARRDIQLSQIVSDVAHGDSPAGRKALKAWNRVQSLTWFGSDAAVESIEEPKITDSGERFTEEPQQLTESPVDFRLPQKQNSE